MSIVIPAHNEEAVIPRLLAALLDPFQTEAVDQIIVVCNGCTDRTAEVARGFGSRITVLETHVASKAKALNLGDEAANSFPRIYIDADVVIDRASVLRLAQALSEPSVLAAAPRPQLDLAGCSAPVRAFYAVDQRMPSHRGGIGGSGVYALSEAGRRRFGRFPDVTADDAFVRRHFAIGERVMVSDARSTVTPPRRVRGLIAIKARSHFGNKELARHFPELAPSPGGNAFALIRLAIRPWWWPAVAIYSYVKLMARLHAWRRLRRLNSGGSVAWARDDTSRRTTIAA